ncbi:MAG: SlyX family protein [Pseudomonadota bacterium]|nr:SlyX family protein [Pseudomonadota bacterium]MDP1905060.1 SlyX family protein [Pseudomonadota bacterium]MDP2351180.1 SlyX family protein [Pseudomonadota bacterium]
MEARLIEIEIKLSYAEDTLETLNQTVFRQQEQIDQLRMLVVRLTNQIQDLTPPERRESLDERPPHY